MQALNQALESLEVRLLESTLGQKFLAWYRGQSDRDQRVFKVLVFLVVSVLLVITLVVPPVNYATGAFSRYQQKVAEHHWLQSHADQARELGSASGAYRDVDQIADIIKSTSSRYGINVSRTRVGDEGFVTVSLQSVPFNQLMQWLDELSVQHGIQASRVKVNSSSQPGLVTVSMELQG